MRLLEVRSEAPLTALGAGLQGLLKKGVIFFKKEVAAIWSRG